MLKTLSETSAFQYANNMGENSITEIIKVLSSGKSGTVYIQPDQMEDAFYKLRHKSFNFAGKFAVIDLFKKGIIRLIYNETHKLTVAIPFFKFKLPEGGFGVIVNLSNYAHMSADGIISIDTAVLYTLMLSGAYSLLIDSQIGNSLNYGLAELYGALFCNVVGRMTNIDQIKRNKLQFIAVKFFYMQLGVNEARASEKASSGIKHIDQHLLEQTDLQLPADTYVNLETLVTGLKKLFPEFTGFDFGVLFDRWMRSYGEATAFALEYVPAFYTMLIALITNCNSMINVKAIEKEASRNDKKLMTLFTKVENSVIDLSQR